MNGLRTLIGSALLATLAGTAAGAAPPPQDNSGENREVGRTTEKELKVTLTSSFGSVIISRGIAEKILIITNASKESGDPKIAMDYAIRNRVGFMDLSLGEGSREGSGHRAGFKLSNFEGGKWFLKFSDAVPISFDVELGVGQPALSREGTV